MKHLQKTLVTFLVITANMYSPMVLADTSTATIEVSGNIPTIFSVTARGYPGDLDLFGSTVVANRLLGTFRFKMNQAPSSIKLATTQASGLPAKAGGGAAYTFAANTFLLNSSCTTISLTAFNPATGGTDGTNPSTGANAKDVKGAAPTTSVDEDCDITASWTNGATIPLAGKYVYNLTMTMIAP